jgi:hypothetical protein
MVCTYFWCHGHRLEYFSFFHFRSDALSGLIDSMPNILSFIHSGFSWPSYYSRRLGLWS